MNRSVISRCRSWSTTCRGRRASTWDRARCTSWRTAAGLRSRASATSGADMPNTSVSTNAARSSGLSDSSTISIAMDTSSASWAAAAPSPRGSGRHRLRQPRADVALLAGGQLAQPVEREPRRHREQERARLVDRVVLDARPADPGLLHDVLGLDAAAEDPVRRPDQRRAVLLEDLGGIVAWSRSSVSSSGPASVIRGRSHWFLKPWLVSPRAELVRENEVLHRDDRSQLDQLGVVEVVAQAGDHLVGDPGGVAVIASAYSRTLRSSGV